MSAIDFLVSSVECTHFRCRFPPIVEAIITWQHQISNNSTYCKSPLKAHWKILDHGTLSVVQFLDLQISFPLYSFLISSPLLPWISPLTTFFHILNFHLMFLSFIMFSSSLSQQHEPYFLYEPPPSQPLQHTWTFIPSKILYPSLLGLEVGRQQGLCI